MRTLLALLCCAVLGSASLVGERLPGRPAESLALQRQSAPASFRVRLETSKGPIVIEVHRDWAPHGADRFYELVTSHYFDDNRFFRVHAGQWAQFGINGDP